MRGRVDRWRELAILLPLAGFCLARGALAQNAQTLDLDARIGFIEGRLDDGRLHSQLWQYGWTGVDAFGLGQGLYGAVTNSGPGKAAPIVDSVKSVIGITYLWVAPLPGLNGADPIRELPGDTPEQKRAQLEVAERLLQANADRAKERWDPLQHVGNVVLNLIGGGIILAFDRTGDAIESTVPGIVAGELQIFSAPWQPTRDLADYETVFGRVASSLEVRPRAGGAELALHF